MTQEEKHLLLQDLSARLPYGVKVRRFVYTTPTDAIESVEVLNPHWLNELYSEEAEFKPYLRPMSSMADEEQKEYDVFCCEPYLGIDETTASNFIDWLNAHHFDYRGLIAKGLALEAPEGMYAKRTNVNT